MVGGEYSLVSILSIYFYFPIAEICVDFLEQFFVSQ